MWGEGEQESNLKKGERMNRKLMYVALTLCVVVVLALSTVWTARSNAKLAPEAIGPNSGKCSLCYTCGGKWPVFGGSFDIPSGSVDERGDSCATPSGFPEPAADFRPYLCCKK